MVPRSADVEHHLVHVGKHSIVRLAQPLADGVRARLFPLAVGCRAAQRKAAANATFIGGLLALHVRHPRPYALCSAGFVEPLAVIEALRVPEPAFDCAPIFGDLCPRDGIAALSPEDIQYAQQRNLRVYVYLDIPRSLHSGLYSRELPREVRLGETCDFVRWPCTPAPPRNPVIGYSVGLTKWFTGMKHAADVPLLAKLLALAAVPGVRTLDPTAADLFVVPFIGGFIERDSPTCAQATRCTFSGPTHLHAPPSPPAFPSPARPCPLLPRFPAMLACRHDASCPSRPHPTPCLSCSTTHHPPPPLSTPRLLPAPATFALNRLMREGKGVMAQLFRQLTHYNSSTASRHIFLLTNSCGGCLRSK